MPLFFLCSGIAFHLSSKKYIQSSVAMTLRNFNNLIIPYFIWSFLFLILIENNRNPEEIITNPFAFFWYLEVLFFSLTIASIFVQKNSNKSRITILGILGAYELLLFIITGNIHIKYAIYYLPYIVIGYTISKYELFRKLQLCTIKFKLGLKVFTTAICLTLLIGLFELQNSIFYFDKILSTVSAYSNATAVISYLMRLCIVMTALLALFAMHHTIHSGFSHLMVIFGIFSLEIYIIHLFVIRALILFESSFIFFAVASTILSLLITFLLYNLVKMQASIGLYRILFGRIPTINHCRI